MFNVSMKEEKKVEYIELIYDLIFVYIIGRNNSLVQHVTNGFIDGEIYLTYLLCTLITIQIWYSTTMFINRYGSNKMSEYIGLFINMYLLYYMADGTRVHWQTHFYRYNIAWMLILVNLLVQYYLIYRETAKQAPWEQASIRQMMRSLAIQIGLLFIGIVQYRFTGLPLTPIALVFGMVVAFLGRKKADLVAVDFPHLTERVMLYIVFTFGEMIIAIAGYFEGEINAVRIYYTVMAFLIVVGLFMSYGCLYNRLLDREMNISGNGYMFLHMFIIFALSNLTTALEFMREEEVAVVPKNIFLIISFVAYYIFLFMTVPYTKGYGGSLKVLRPLGIALVVFVALMAFSYSHPMISIGISAALTFAIWYMEFNYWKKLKAIGRIH